MIMGLQFPYVHSCTQNIAIPMYIKYTHSFTPMYTLVHPYKLMYTHACLLIHVYIHHICTYTLIYTHTHSYTLIHMYSHVTPMYTHAYKLMYITHNVHVPMHVYSGKPICTLCKLEHMYITKTLK